MRKPIYPSTAEEMLAGVPEERRALAQSVLKRVMPLMVRMLREARKDMLKECLAAPSDVGMLARLLAATAGAGDTSADAAFPPAKRRRASKRRAADK
jgi:hypothetical protein